MSVNEIIFECYKQINNLRVKIHNTNDKAIEFAVGEMTEDEFAPIREQRRAWRNEINALETKIKTLKG